MGNKILSIHELKTYLEEEFDIRATSKTDSHHEGYLEVRIGGTPAKYRIKIYTQDNFEYPYRHGIVRGGQNFGVTGYGDNGEFSTAEELGKAIKKYKQEKEEK